MGDVWEATHSVTGRAVAIKTAHDFFLKYSVISKPVDLAAAYNASFIESIPLSDRRP